MKLRKSRAVEFHGLNQELSVNRIMHYSFLHFLLVLGVHSKDILLQFTQTEEQDAGQTVGSVSSSPVILQMVGHQVRSDLRYSILPDGNDNSNLFKIDATSGNITFSRRVDREIVCPLSRVCEFSFGVAVSGGNNFFRRIPAKVAIVDLNDNSPVFQDPATVEIRISEDAPENFTRTLPVATDADSSVEFGINSYTIDPPSDMFRLDISRNFLGISQVSLVLSQKLDRESTDGYQLVVVAKDGGQPPRSATLNVNISVDDVNDNRPHFVKKIYNVGVAEDAGSGDEILTVSASDDDIGDNGRVVYSLASLGSGNPGEIVDKISINASTGVITLVRSLVNGEYRFWVDAHDLGSPRRYDQTLVSLTVLDTINNQPTVRMNLVQKDTLPLGWLPEGLEINTVVAVISADDPDSGNNGDVTCQSQDSNFLLESLESRRYKLMLAQSLDRETKTTYTATVTCWDQGIPRLSATASTLITVVDVNDNSPRFSQESYVYNIVENNMRGDTVALITASDKDEGQNAVMTYMLMNDGGDFIISRSTGIITANSSFDRERVNQYTFQVVAADHGQPSLSGTATVIVNIFDLNDNDPVFSLREYNFRLYENKEPGSAVGNISVTDPDLGDDGAISLSLRPTDDNDAVPFSIDNQGRISSLQTFDREYKNMYNFEVIATDNGSQKRSSSVQVIVDILDINDNAPAFVFPSERNYSTTLNMPIQKDTIILHIDVYDADDNQNGLVIHSIIDNNASQFFSIETLTGHLVSRRDLNIPSMAGEYYLTINATDQGSPPLWQTRTLQLILQSESTSAGDVMVDQNLLIVACIVCFTIIISGVVLVAICLVRSQDRRKKIHYHASVCRELAADCNTGLTSQCGQQCSLETSKTRQEPQPIDPTPSYQQLQYQHNNSNIYSNNVYTVKTLTDSSRLGTGVKVPDRQHHVPVASTQNLQGSDTSRNGQDDFNSTASTETGTGDSGHGSDEEVSSSVDPGGLLPVLDEHGVSLGTVASKHRESVPDISQRRTSQQHVVSLTTVPVKHRESIPDISQRRPSQQDGFSLATVSSKHRESVPDISQRRCSQQHGVSLMTVPATHRNYVQDISQMRPSQQPASLQPSALKTSRLRANSCSVRFDPRVTDIHDHRHPLRSQPHGPPIRGRSSSVPCSVLPLHQSHTGELFRVQQTPMIQQQAHGQSQRTYSYQLNHDKAIRPHYLGERPNLPSVSSLGDSCNEDSDLNTTTSGSYSIISDTMFHMQGLEVSRLRDRHV